MKRFFRLASPLVTLLGTMLVATPALAQEYYSDGEAGLAFGILACYGIVILIALALFVWWVILLIDVFKRQEWEFPGSTGSSKTTWLIIMLVGWFVGLSGLAAILYYFMVYKKGPKAGTVPPPGAQAAPQYAAPQPTAVQPPAPPAPPAPAAAPPAPPAAPPAPPMEAPAPPAPPSEPAPPAPPAAPPAPEPAADEPGTAE